MEISSIKSRDELSDELKRMLASLPQPHCVKCKSPDITASAHGLKANMNGQIVVAFGVICSSCGAVCISGFPAHIFTSILMFVLKENELKETLNINYQQSLAEQNFGLH